MFWIHYITPGFRIQYSFDQIKYRFNITVTAPHAKANTSVTLVTVTATPAWRSAWAILWSEVRPALASSGLLFTLERDCRW